MDENAATPVRAARYRLHSLAGDLDVGVAVAVPFPIGRGADRLHDELAEDLWQRPSPQPQQCQTQSVDADVVVFPERPGRLQVPVCSLFPGSRAAADATVAIDEVRLAPQLALPFRGLLQQMMPGDRAIVRPVEAAIIDGAAHRLV